MPSGVYTRTTWHRERLMVPRPGSGRHPGLGRGKYLRLKKEYIQKWNIETKQFDVSIIKI